MRILLIGSTGQLGSDLVRHAGGKHEILGPPRDQLDLCRLDHIQEALNAYRPELVINCAAFHNVPLCEKEPEQAFRVNCVAVRDLAIACRNADVQLLTFSSDYVFGGDKRAPYAESDPPRPLQIYGITRVAGEHAAMSMAPEHTTIVRTCGLYGVSGARSKGGNFVDGRVADVRAGKRISMAMDQTVAPTSTEDLSKAVLELIGSPGLERGIYHLVNEGQCTWYDFTVAITEELSLNGEVVPVDYAGLTGNVRRPLYSVLGNHRARSLRIVLPPWREALRRYLRRKYPGT